MDQSYTLENLTIDNESQEELLQWSIYQEQGSEAALDLPEEPTVQIMFQTARQALHNRRNIQAPVRSASYDLFPHGAALAHEEIATSDTTQSNAFFQNARGFTIKGNPSFRNQNIRNITNVFRGGKDGLEKLNGFISFDAQFDSSAQDPDRQCHPGTRENVLKRLRGWADDPKSEERICWLHGPAGAGKSAIAQTIARSYARPKVAATFFFFKSDVNRNDGNRLFTTLAYQIALSMPEIRDHIAHSLYERPDLPKTDVETQFNQLLARPFQTLSDDATHQLAPAVIVDILKRYRDLGPVIIIDGVDECVDEKLQQRFLKVIGDVVNDNRFPLRFLIVSRPEFHIEQSIKYFQTPILPIDLAKLDDANRDIEKYLVDGFSRIASEQGLDPAWPGNGVIDNIVYKSSGNFIFPSLVIRFVGDPYCFAMAQLDIVLNIKVPKMMTPFAVLDQLFLEILRRVPDQEFLKRFLVLLVARISVSGDYGELYQDDAVLMHVSELELHANLRRMRSLLEFEPFIDVHHRSFLDFLQDSSRSSEYCIRQQGGIKEYLKVFIDSLIRFVYAVIEDEQSDHRNIPHFKPKFREVVKWYPPKINLSVEGWEEVTQPLIDLQDKLLQLPNYTSNQNILRCDQCTVFQLMRELIHLGLHVGFRHDTSVEEAKLVRSLRNRSGIAFSVTDETRRYRKDNVLYDIDLPETMENESLDPKLINLTYGILRFDYTETAMRIRSVSEAQKLVDLLDFMIHTKNVLHGGAVRKAGLLALEIFARIPIVPISYFLMGNDTLLYKTGAYRPIHIEVLSQTILAKRILDYRYIIPVMALTWTGTDENRSTMNQWRQKSTPSAVTTIQIMLRLAKAIQYLHSMGVVLHHQFNSRDVFLDSNNYPRIYSLYSTCRTLLDKDFKTRFSPEGNIFSLGCLFYELYTDDQIWLHHSTSFRRLVNERGTSKQTIPDCVWQLIQRCCAEDVNNRPTIDKVVEEIASWHSAEQVEPDELAKEMEGSCNTGHEKPDEVVKEMEGSHRAGHVEPDEVVKEMEGSHGAGHIEPDEVVKEMEGSHGAGHVEPDEVAKKMEGSYGAGHVKPDEFANEVEGLRGGRYVEPDEVAMEHLEPSCQSINMTPDNIAAPYWRDRPKQLYRIPFLLVILAIFILFCSIL